MVVGLFLGAAVCSLAYGQGHVLFYPADMLVFTLVLGLLMVGVVTLADIVLLAFTFLRFKRTKQIVT
jgi:hypothetical protein